MMAVWKNRVLKALKMKTGEVKIQNPFVMQYAFYSGADLYIRWFACSN